MKTWRLVLLTMLPMLAAAGHYFRAQDENDTGSDDITGISLEYMAQLGSALVNNQPLPRAPDVLRSVTRDDDRAKAGLPFGDKFS